jgi:hypothetical protein
MRHRAFPRERATRGMTGRAACPVAGGYGLGAVRAGSRTVLSSARARA